MGKARNSTTGPRRKWLRRSILFCVGLFLVLGAWAYVYLYLKLPVGSGPAGPMVDRHAFDSVWTTRKVVLLGLGDSVTAGFGVPFDKGYVARLADNPDDEWPDMRGLCLRRVIPNLSVRNMAVSGTTSLNHMERIRDDLEVQPPDTFGLVVMTSGGNDLIHNYGRTPPREGAMYGATLDEARPWIEAFERRLNGMLDLIDERFPGGCHVFLADIYDPSDGVGHPEKAGLPKWDDCLAVIGAYNDVIHRVCEQRANVHCVPMHDAFLGHGVHCTQPWREHYRRDDPHYWYGIILEDPNQRGFDAIRRLFLNEMVRLIPAIAEPKSDTPSEPRP